MENTELEVVTEHEVAGGELQILREKAQIDIQVSTARAYPRNIAECLSDAIFTATMDYETAEACTYAVPRGSKVISGPSVRMAEILLQSWGNMRADTKVIEETSKHVISESFAWDLQKNNAVKITVKRSIMTKSGKMNDDMVTVTGNAANAIAFRNAMFKVIPRAITDKVYSAVQVKIIGGEGEFEKKLKDTLKAFKTKYSIEQFAVMSLVGKNAIKDIKPADLVVLIGIGTALKNGEITIESLFKQPAKTGDEKKADLKAKKEAEAKDPEKTEETPDPKDEVKTEVKPSGLQMP